MTAQQLQSEQDLMMTMERNTATLQRIIIERDAFRSALEKIHATRLLPLTCDEKADRMVEIAEKTLNSKT